MPGYGGVLADLKQIAATFRERHPYFDPKAGPTYVRAEAEGPEALLEVDDGTPVPFVSPAERDALDLMSDQARYLVGGFETFARIVRRDFRVRLALSDPSRELIFVDQTDKILFTLDAWFAWAALEGALLETRRRLNWSGGEGGDQVRQRAARQRIDEEAGGPSAILRSVDNATALLRDRLGPTNSPDPLTMLSFVLVDDAGLTHRRAGDLLAELGLDAAGNSDQRRMRVIDRVRRARRRARRV